MISRRSFLVGTACLAAGVASYASSSSQAMELTFSEAKSPKFEKIFAGQDLNAAKRMSDNIFGAQNITNSQMSCPTNNRTLPNTKRVSDGSTTSR